MRKGGMHIGLEQPITRLRSFWSRLLEEPQNAIVLLIFSAHLCLVFYDFLPNLKDINFWDEASYINWGRFLVEGRLPTFSQNPLMALFYAILYLPFMKSPYWLVQVCSLGRFLMFLLLWLSAYLAARTLKDIFSPILFYGFLLVLPVTTEILGNPSDAMFTVTSAFAFWQVLTYWRDRKRKNLMLASLFVGLAALARNDGIVVFVIFIFLSLFLSLKMKSGWKNVLSVFIPFVLLVGGYLGISGIVNHDYSTGMLQRSYVAFEQGHEGVYEDAGIHSHTIDAMLDARRIFGTPQENNYSVLKAISRNPKAYLARLIIILERLPEQLLTVYNKKLAILIFFLALRGIFELIRKKQYTLLLILFTWPAYLLTYFLTFFRDGYLRTPFFVLLFLASIGLAALSSNLEKKTERWIASLVLMLLVVAGLIFSKLAIFYGASLFLIALWMIILIRQRFREFPSINPLSLMVLLLFGMVLHGNFSSPKIQYLGINADEKAAVYLMDHYPRGTKVGAGSPGVVWMAKMEFSGIIGTDVPEFRTSADFHQWLLNEGIEVIYLDYSISNHAPYFWELIQQETGKGLTEVFSENMGSNRIYKVNPVG